MKIVDTPTIQETAKHTVPVFRSRAFWELPEAIAEVRIGMKTKPLVQFIMDWNHFPQDREEMLTGELPPDCPTEHAAAIASVVHALCDRDGYKLPKSLKGLQADKEITLSLRPVATPFTRKVRSLSPEVCHEHKVFYEADLLDTK